MFEEYDDDCSPEECENAAHIARIVVKVHDFLDKELSDSSPMDRAIRSMVLVTALCAYGRSKAAECEDSDERFLAFQENTVAAIAAYPRHAIEDLRRQFCAQQGNETRN